MYRLVPVNTTLDEEMRHVYVVGVIAVENLLITMLLADADEDIGEASSIEVFNGKLDGLNAPERSVPLLVIETCDNTVRKLVDLTLPMAEARGFLLQRR